MKKSLRSTISMLILTNILFCSYAAAYAVDISPRYTGISSLSSSLTISSAGKASCEGSAVVRNGYTADLTVSLKQDGTTIKTWSTSGSGIISAGNTYYVASGHEYFVRTTATVYNSDGKIVEVQSTDSQTRSY